MKIQISIYGSEQGLTVIEAPAVPRVGDFIVTEPLGLAVKECEVREVRWIKFAEADDRAVLTAEIFVIARPAPGQVRPI